MVNGLEEMWRRERHTKILFGLSSWIAIGCAAILGSLFVLCDYNVTIEWIIAELSTWAAGGISMYFQNRFIWKIRYQWYEEIRKEEESLYANCRLYIR